MFQENVVWNKNDILSSLNNFLHININLLDKKYFFPNTNYMFKNKNSEDFEKK